jgi:hypothetical protein
VAVWLALTLGDDVGQGEWVNGESSGFGVSTTSTGSMFMGEWLEGQREGTGVELTGEGDYYRGEWKNDSPNGYVRRHSLRLPAHATRSHCVQEWECYDRRQRQ